MTYPYYWKLLNRARSPSYKSKCKILSCQTQTIPRRPLQSRNQTTSPCRLASSVTWRLSHHHYFTPFRPLTRHPAAVSHNETTKSQLTSHNKQTFDPHDAACFYMTLRSHVMLLERRRLLSHVGKWGICASRRPSRADVAKSIEHQ